MSRKIFGLAIIISLVFPFYCTLYSSSYSAHSFGDRKNDTENNFWIQIINNLDITAEYAPSVPQILSPSNESTQTSHVVRFDWTDVGIPADDIFYEFMMDNDTDFNSPEVARFAINDWSNSTMNEEPYTIFLAHFNNTYQSEEGEDPVDNYLCPFTTGKFGDGVNITFPSKLAYNTTGNLNTEEGTIEFWIRLESNISNISGFPYLFDYEINTTSQDRLSIMISSLSDFIFVMTNFSGKVYYLYPNRQILWNAGEWHHFCLTWGNEMARLYLDGIEEAASPYFPIGSGDGDTFYLGSHSVGLAQVNATYDELRISSIQRLPLWKDESDDVNVTYFGLPIQRFPMWDLNESEYTHMFERDDTYYWKVRAHNASGPGQWTSNKVVNINRNLNSGIPISLTIYDNMSDLVWNANVSYEQEVVHQIMGVDANYLLDLNKAGYVWYHEGNPISLYDFFANRCANSFRTRLWTKNGSSNSLDNATLMAKWAQDNGTRPFLTIFLSDDWADVNKQPLPEAFQGLTFEQRLQEVENYSKNVTSHFINQNISMDFYAIGNEIDYGICGVFANDTQPRHNLTWLRENIWYNSARIINASIEGVLQADPTAQFLLHIAISDPAFALAFFTAMSDFGVPYDMMGLSYYPVVNGDGSENGFKETFKILSTSGLRGSDKIIFPESAYSSQNNGSIVFGWNTSIKEYPLTPEGQKNWLKDQLEWNYQHPNVAGYIYWSPELYNEIWEGLSWFNATSPTTGDSKAVVDAYPEFYNSRNVSISGSQYSNLNGFVNLNAYRGNISITVEICNHTERYNFTISPFRPNNFIINLSIDVPPPPDFTPFLIAIIASTMTSESTIFGIPTYMFFGIIALIGLVTVAVIIKKKKGTKAPYYPDKKP